MTMLEKLYHGYINPSESERLSNNPKYNNLIALTAKAQEKIVAVLNDEQKKLSENYIVNARNYLQLLRLIVSKPDSN